MRDGAPILHDDLRMKEFGERTGKVSNIADHFRFTMGDVAQGFAEADGSSRTSFTPPPCTRAISNRTPPPRCGINDGRVLVWCSTQGAFVVRDVTACVLDIPVSQVKVTPTEIGGGFGGKIPVYLEPVAAMLSKKSGRPVKIAMSRKDVFEGTGPTPGSYIEVKIGVSNDGRITAAQAMLAYEAGAYPGAMAGPGAMCVFAAYDIANVSIDGYDVVVNKPSTAAYRAPGATNAAFATESLMDQIAADLGIDPLELRLKNAAKEGTRRADGPKYRRIGCVEVIEAMKNHPALHRAAGGPEPRPRRRDRVLVQCRAALVLHAERQRRRHGRAGGRLHRYRRHAHLHQHAGRRSAGHSGEVGPANRGRYGFDRIHGRHRRQPYHVRHRHGRGGSRAGRHPPDHRTRAEDLGHRRPPVL